MMSNERKNTADFHPWDSVEGLGWSVSQQHKRVARQMGGFERIIWGEIEFHWLPIFIVDTIGTAHRFLVEPIFRSLIFTLKLYCNLMTEVENLYLNIRLWVRILYIGW